MSATARLHHPPFHSIPRRFVPVSVVPLLFGFLVAPPALAADLPYLRVYGNDEILWVYLRRPDHDETRSRQFAFRRRSETAADLYLPLPIEPVRGRVVHGAVRGSALHVFYGDGTHHRYVPFGRTWSRSRAPLQFPELNLEDSALPSVLAADGTRGVLYALVTARQAARIEPAVPGDIPDVNGSAVELEPVLPVPDFSTDRTVIRYENGRWLPDRDGPSDLALNGQVLTIWARNGAVHLIYHPEPPKDTFVHRFSAEAEMEWSGPVAVPFTDPPVPCQAGWIDATPVLVVGQRHAEKTTLRCLRFTAGEWVTTSTLADEANEPILFAAPPAVAWSQGQIAVAALSAEGDPQVGLWSPTTGRPTEPPTGVTALTQQLPSGMSAPASALIQYAILGATLVAVFAWRRDSVLKVVPLAPGQVFGRLPRRAVALGLDVAVLLPIWMPALFLMWYSDANGLTLGEQLAINAEIMRSRAVWGMAVFGAIVGLYAAILEAVTGTTLGKRICGLWVVGEGGERCRLGATVLRNLVRVVEFLFVPLFVLVWLTPSRQRLGDILARTVVVEHGPTDRETVPPPDHDEDT